MARIPLPEATKDQRESAKRHLLSIIGALDLTTGPSVEKMSYLEEYLATAFAIEHARGRQSNIAKSRRRSLNGIAKRALELCSLRYSRYL
jgi:hypothetical protein